MNALLLISLIALVLSCASAKNDLKDIINQKSKPANFKDSAKRDYAYDYSGTRTDEISGQTLVGYKSEGELYGGGYAAYYEWGLDDTDAE